MNVEIVKLLESDLPKLLMHGQLSKATGFSLQVYGQFGKREAEALKTFITTQIDILFQEEPKP